MPIAVYHHEPSRRKLIELEINKIDNKVDNYNNTGLQHVCMYVASSCLHHNIHSKINANLLYTNMCTTYSETQRCGNVNGILSL